MSLQEELMKSFMGKRSISADTALRLGRFFGVSPQFWINLQAHYDLEIEKDKLGRTLEKEVKVYTELAV